MVTAGGQLVLTKGEGPENELADDGATTSF